MSKLHTARKVSGNQLEETVTGILKNINNIDPANIQCMMGVVVVKPEEGSEMNGVHVFAIGDDNEIPKMIVQLIESSRNGIRATEDAEDAEEINHSGVVH